MALRRTPLRRVNPVRQEKRRAEQFGPHGERLKALRCCACAALPPVDPHHARTRAAGGTWRDQAPLCRRCHRQLDSPGWSQRAFEEHHGIDLAEVAAMLAEVALRDRTACSAEDLTRRLLRIPAELRIPMLHACPVRIPKAISTGRVRDLAEWLVTWQGAHEVGRTVDLWEALEAWRLERQGRA